MDVRIPLRAVGITAGIGSMLAAARSAGFQVLGNIEWRPDFHFRDRRGQNTFRMNFPGIPFVGSIQGLTLEQVDDLTGADLIVSHPECGHFSKLDAVNRKGSSDRLMDAFDIPLAIKLIARLKPRYFILDDLPLSLVPFPMSEYAKRLPDYCLFPEMIGKFFYGNAQRGRNRMFMIGALRTERFVFVPNEDSAAGPTVRDVIGDLVDADGEPLGNYHNHHPHVVDAACANAKGLIAAGRRSTWREVKEYMSRQPSGHAVKYFHSTDGSVRTKIGFVKTSLGWSLPRARRRLTDHPPDKKPAADDQGASAHPGISRRLSVLRRGRRRGFALGPL